MEMVQIVEAYEVQARSGLNSNDITMIMLFC
jgi:hypothetical protein